MLIYTVDPNLKISLSILITVVACVGVIVIIATWLVIKAARNRPFIGQEGMAGKIAVVKKNGFVYVNGALWKMTSDDQLEIGDKVEVVSVDNMVLRVKKIES